MLLLSLVDLIGCNKYTPPSLLNVQPIEMIWSYLKRLYVARAYIYNNSFMQLMDDLCNAVDGEHAVIAELCRKDIEHVHK
jgi:hypothetical protein